MYTCPTCHEPASVAGHKDYFVSPEGIITETLVWSCLEHKHRWETVNTISPLDENDEDIFIPLPEEEVISEPEKTPEPEPTEPEKSEESSDNESKETPVDESDTIFAEVVDTEDDPVTDSKDLPAKPRKTRKSIDKTKEVE